LVKAKKKTFIYYCWHNEDLNAHFNSKKKKVDNIMNYDLLDVALIR